MKRNGESVEKTAAKEDQAVVVRCLQPEDSLLEISCIYEESWKTAYKDIVPQTYLNKIPKGNWIAFLETMGIDTLVMLQGDKIIGTCSYSLARQPDMEGWGELISLYLLPAYMGKGMGQLLFDRAICALEKLNLEGIYLWVLEENRRARRFYEKKGFVPSNKVLEDCIDGKKLFEIQYIKKI